MSLSFDPEPYALVPALLHWLAVFGIGLGVFLLMAVFASLVTRGWRGPLAVGREIAAGLSDTAGLSARRVWALTLLTMKEAIRRKALLVFVVFAVLFMFAGWFLPATDLRPDLQVKNYVSFALRTITWLILPVVVLLSCWGLPEDIKSRSLHTVVTKPVRRNEIVLGRILGFAGIGTFVLAIMGLVGFFWVVRQVPADAQGSLTCRVPIYGTLSFTDRDGNTEDGEGNPVGGVNVGDIWMFRDFIEGATRARAIWEFEGVTPAAMRRLSQGADGELVERLVLESNFEAFRTHKGDMNRGLLCQFELVNEENGLRVPHTAFEVKEFGETLTYLDRSISFYDEEAQSTRIVDLFDDLAPNGRLRVEARAVDAGQYLGMARPDLFIRMPDRPFAAGYFKALGGTWLMTILLVMLGVTASCFLKGPVAMLLTFTLAVVGTWFYDFLGQMVTQAVDGGGFLESVYRIVHHMNPQVPLEESTGIMIMQQVDEVIKGFLWLVYHIVPNFNHFRMSEYVANGFDVPWDAAFLPGLATTLAFVLPCLLLGYYSLKLRELESK